MPPQSLAQHCTADCGISREEGWGGGAKGEREREWERVGEHNDELKVCAPDFREHHLFGVPSGTLLSMSYYPSWFRLSDSRLTVQTAVGRDQVNGSRGHGCGSHVC